MSIGHVTCEPAACDPEWLCTQGRDLPYTSVVTASHIATDLGEQYRLLLENAVEQMQVMYGVHVEATEVFAERASNRTALPLGKAREREHTESQIQYQGGAREPRLALTDTCKAGSLYYARAMLHGTKPATSDRPLPEDWHLQPPAEQGEVAVGSFSGYLARNLLSSKIMAAIENGLVDLAQMRHTEITSEEVAIQKEEGNVYSATWIRGDTEAELEAELRAVRIQGTSPSPTVYVLVEAL